MTAPTDTPAEEKTMKDGDIFWWRWKPGLEKGFGDPYWCKTRRAIVIDGKLYDLFWVHHGAKLGGGGYGPTKGNAESLPLSRIDLTFIDNLSDLVEIWPGSAKFYSAGDVVDLRHSNNGNAPVMVRAGAKRAREAVVSVLQREIADLEADLRRTQQRLDDRRRALVGLDDLDEVPE